MSFMAKKFLALHSMLDSTLKSCTFLEFYHVFGILERPVAAVRGGMLCLLSGKVVAFVLKVTIM